MKRIFKETLKHKGALALVLLTVIGNVLSNLALPAYLSNIINQSIPNRDIYGIFMTGGNMLIFVILGIVSTITTGFFSARISMMVGRDMRSQIFNKIQYFSQTEFDEFSTSSLITRSNNDVVQIQTFLNMVLRISLMAPFMCVGGIIMAFAKNAAMSAILLISVPLMAVFILSVSKVATPVSKTMQQKIDQINLVTREKLTGIRVARAFGTENYEASHFEEVNGAFMKNAIKMNTVIGITVPGLSLILYGTMVALLAFGGYQIIHLVNGVPIGDIIAVIQYVMQIMMSVMMLSIVFVMYPRASVSADRISEVLETISTIQTKEGAVTEGTTRGSLCFKDVTFTFPGSSEPAIKNISFQSNPGEVTAIIGSTGSGKSTIINLIPRFYDVNQGQVLVDGVDVRDFDLKALRSKIGLVPQKAFLFKGTISDNIAFGRDNAIEAEIVSAAKIAQSYEFISAKEDGFDAPISQGGSNVSGGQKQRLSIARALLRKPEIYVFDDSFSALDFKTDAALRKALLTEAKDATVILVAQRVSTIMNADRILVLESGECVGQGRHDELMKSCDVYREIVYSQLSKEEA